MPQDNSATNKRIAKNTMFLYFRMILIMGVTLYTSRVILDKLGVEDYGLYQVVGGVVGILSFLNGTLSIGTSRFLTYELGTGNLEKLKRTFSTGFYTHVILALIVVVLMETGGLWFLYNKLIIPADRLDACFWVFQLSIFTTFVAITQVPYTAIIMAHERMGIYAYISVFEALAKLGVCYLLSVSSYDKLVFYAILIAMVQLLVAAFYRIYSIKNFIEAKILLVFDRPILKKLLGFSGWNIMANLSETLGKQGIIVVVNMFFSPVVVASQALTNQVNSAVLQFVNNFRTAINPQIIKLYAAGEKEKSMRLTLDTTVYCFDLILVLGLPAIIVMDKLMYIWLVEVPEYAVIFTQWAIARSIIGTFNASFYTPMLAANKIKTNSMAAVVFGVGEFILLYVVFCFGAGPMWIQYLGTLVTFLFSLGVKPFVLYKEINYPLKDMVLCYFSCIKILVCSLFLSYLTTFYLDESIIESILKAILSAFSVVLSAYIFLDHNAKRKINNYLINKFLKLKKS